MKTNPVAAVLLLLLSASCTAPKQQPVQKQEPDTGWRLTSERVTPDRLQEALKKLKTNPRDALLLRRVGMYYQILSPPDRWDYLDHAVTHLNAAREQLGDDPATVMYLGLATAAKGLSPHLGPFKKLTAANQGFALMDHAVALEPDNFSLRLLRAKAALPAPPFLGRGKLLQEDHAWLQPWIDNPANHPHLRLRGLIFLGDYQDRRRSDRQAAQKRWRQAAELNPDDPFTAVAQSRLDGSQARF